MGDLSKWMLFLGITVALSMVFRNFFKKYIFNCILSAVMAVFLFQVIDFIQLGYVDPFFLIAIPVGFLIAFTVSLLVGIFIGKR